ncbi:MAG: A/G-specific adenine glycosylase [Flavobacteriales bacterium]|nr:A/G-specific adenine glycosylase [Flavobacteriales bacterium]
MPSLSWFSRRLLPWYREHQRPLPWRADRDPYRVWLSEVILQQTRVDQGMAYWERIVARYPTVADLASAPEDEVLKHWQGLGYYSRARNLRTAAQQVVKEHRGAFPERYEALRGLKGVGEYTAAAIGSICFGLPEPVVDGNVYRVLSRVFGLSTPIDSTAGRKEFRALAATLLDPKQPGDHNQAVMELGATVCTPKTPRCSDCPLSTRCIALATGRVAELPVKAGRTKVRTRHFNYLHISNARGTFLRKRIEKDIWQGLHEFPLIGSTGKLGPKKMGQTLAERYGEGWTLGKRHGPVKHVLSHQVIQAMFWTVEAPRGFRPPDDWVHVREEALGSYAVSRLMERYLTQMVGR